jgi:predicted Zn-dependent peptidase
MTDPGPAEPEQPPSSTEGTGPEPPSEAEELRQEIRQTREELGHTLETVAEKADVSAQAQQVKAQAQERVDERKEQLRQSQEAAKAKAGEVREQIEQATPEQARAVFRQLQQQARDNPLPAAVIGLVVASLLVRRLRRR